MSKITPIETSKEGIILTVSRPIKGYSNPILFSVEYSGDNDILELEWIRPIEEGLTNSQFLDIENLLECGYEETLCNELEKLYSMTKIKFSPNHYDSCL
jgi:hypothetical protein